MTINDIAKLSGVSKATVSRVINGSKPVSPEITAKVQKIIEENNFKPSRIARNLSNKESKLIGVIVPDFSNPIFAKVLEGIELEAVKESYNILLCNSRLHSDIELNYLNLLMEKEVDGLLYNGFNITDEIKAKLEGFKAPVIMIGVESESLAYPVVEIDNFKAGRDVAEFLRSKNHKQTAMIHGPLNDPYSGKMRMDGFLSVYHDTLLIEGNYKVSDGFKAMKKLLKKTERPTAVFCANDEMAIGAIKAVTDIGLNVPKDISIIGFDNIEMSEIYNPSLSTVDQPFREIGKEAMELLSLKISGEEVAPKTVKKHKIIDRNSVAEL